jgi:DNA invertase Pin-like site-specific DNA recombinase
VDTTPPQGRLVVSILAAISQFERELILSRITEGRKRARANGIRLGRKPKLTNFQRQESLERLAAGESQSSIAATYDVDRATISRLARA